MWITSSRVLPITMLVVIPFSITILAISLSDIVPVTQVQFTQPEFEAFFYVFSYLSLVSASSLVYALYFIKFDFG
jgi:hypothetical protein